MNNYFESVIKLFGYYRELGDKAISRLNDDQLNYKITSESNSVAIIVKHLSGNMLSRFSDFLTSDGEKPWRKRDEEFEDDYINSAELIKSWNQGWDCLLTSLKGLDESHLNSIVYIRNEGHTVMEAIHRQLAHYAYHVGQIVFIAKAISNKNWASLSIPKGNSNAYNAEKFNKEKERKHFTG